MKRRACRTLVEVDLLVQVEFAHQLEQHRLVRRRGRPERSAHASEPRDLREPVGGLLREQRAGVPVIAPEHELPVAELEDGGDAAASRARPSCGARPRCARPGSCRRARPARGSSSECARGCRARAPASPGSPPGRSPSRLRRGCRRRRSPRRSAPPRRRSRGGRDRGRAGADAPRSRWRARSGSWSPRGGRRNGRVA